MSYYLIGESDYLIGGSDYLIGGSDMGSYIKKGLGCNNLHLYSWEVEFP